MDPGLQSTWSNGARRKKPFDHHLDYTPQCESNSAQVQLPLSVVVTLPHFHLAAIAAGLGHAACLFAQSSEFTVPALCPHAQPMATWA